MGFISDLVGGGDAKKAARAQQQGFQEGQATFENAGNTATARFDPYANTGMQANRLLSAAMGGDVSAFQQSPGYEFALEQGLKAANNAGSAGGMSMSGAQLKGLNNYAQGMANQEYGNWFNRLLNLSGQGMNAAGNQANIDMGTAQGVANMQTGNAGARASGYMANANIKNALTNNILGSITDVATAYAPKPGGVG